jgi:integrase
VRVLVSGVNTVTKTLADGTRKKYYYHRSTGIPIEGEPGSPKFIANYAAAEASAKDREKGVLLQLIRQYTSSPEFSQLAPSTQAEYRRMLTSAECEFGPMPIAALDDPRVKGDFLDWRDVVAKESGNREADHRLSTISAMLTWSADRGKIAINHLKGFSRLYHTTREEIIWLPKHIRAFMACASVQMQQAMILGLHSAQREGDLIHLPWSAYDGEALWIRPGKGTKKGKKASLRPIPCTERLREMLDGMERVSPLVLTTSRGRAFKKRYFCKLWSDAMTQAGIETVQLPGFDEPVRLHFHDLRGTTVTLLAEAGCSIPEIAAITGHSLDTVHRIIERYLKLTRGLAEEAMFKFQKSKRSKFVNSLRAQKT